MTCRAHGWRWLRLLGLCGLVLMPLQVLSAPTGVLVLASYGFGRSGADLYLQSLTAELTRLGVPAQDIHVEYLDSQWGASSGAARHKRAWLLEGYAQSPPAAVVTLQQPALDFALRELLPGFHGAALLAVQGQLPDGRQPQTRLPERTLQQAASLDLTNGLQQALRLFPATRHVLMLAGTDPQDQATKRAMVQAATPFAGRLTVEYTDVLTREQTLRRVADLPRHSIVFHGNVNQDAEGTRLTPNEVNRRVTERANAPVFALVSDMLGSGVVGGSLLDPAHEARRAAARLHDHLGGHDPWPPGVQTLATQTLPAYDWRALARWNAQMDALPAQAQLLHRPASLWVDNRNTVLTVLAVGVLLLAALLVLLVENRHRRRAQALAQASEARWRVLFEHAPDAILLHDLDRDHIVAANPAAERLFACDVDTLRRRTPASFEGGSSAGHDAVERSPAGPIADVCIRDAQGQDRLCVRREVRLPDTGRRLVRLSYVDITERARERQALRTSEERWQFALEGAGQGVWDHDLLSGRAYHSPRYLHLLGYEAGGLDQRVDAWIDLVHPDDQLEAVARTRACLRGDCAAFVCELRMRRRDGRWLWVAARGMVVARDPLGRAVRTVGTLSDIHARKEAEDALEVAALLYRHAAEGMMVSDEGANILAVNDAFLHMLGYSREDVVGQKSYSLRATRPEEDNRHQLWAHLRREGHWRGELWLRHKDGREMPFLFSINAIVATPSTPRRYVSLFADNAEHRRHEQRLWHEAHHDALTGLPNRHQLLQRLARAVDQCRPGEEVALVLIDLDQFKPVNDSFGPQAGDALLREVAQRMAGLVRDGDLLARMGADEFVLMLTGLQGEAQALDLARHVIASVRPMLMMADRCHHITASAGVALAPLHAQCADDLIRRAGQALSQAKQAGGDTVRAFRNDLEAQMQYRMRVAADLRGAVERGKWRSATSPSSIWRRGQYARPKRWCVGTTPITLGSVRAPSYRLPKKSA